MCRSEHDTLPRITPPPTADEALKFKEMRAANLVEDTDMTVFHTDEDVLRKVKRLAIMGIYPTPADDDIKCQRAFLCGVHEAARYLLRVPRGGGMY